MATATTERLLQQLRQLLATSGNPADSDRHLLDRFTATRDQAAFTTLVERHGPMVLGVCRRVLGDVAAVEDVFQATFLALARRPNSIRRRDTVGGWLYGVAQRLARKVLTSDSLRRRHERQAAADQPTCYTTDPAWQELLTLLDAELQRLPERYRAPLLACYLEGRTQDEAARELGWSLSTLRRRLVRGRELLRLRLSRRGATLSTALFAGVLAPQALTAVVPHSLLRTTAHLASSGGVVPAAVAGLAEEGLTAAWPLKLKVLLVLLLAAGFAGAWAYHSPAERPTAPPVPTAAPPELTPVTQKPPTDLYGDPLPPGASARLGTAAFRHMEQVWALAYSPDGKWLATADRGYTVRIWETATGRLVHEFSAGGCCRHDSLAFSPDSKRMAQAAVDGRLHVWDLTTGKEESDRPIPAKGKFWTFAPGFLADGQAVFAFSGDEEPLALYEAGTRERLRLLKTTDRATRNLVFSPDGKMLAVSLITKMDLVTLDTGQVLHTLQTPDKEIGSMAFSLDGRLLVSTSVGSVVRIWDTTTGKELRSFAPPDRTRAARQSAAVSPDGKLLALAGYVDSSVRLVQMADGKEVARLEGPDANCRALAFAPDGRTVAAGCGNQVRLWDTTTGKEWGADRAGHRLRATAVAYAPDGKTLVSGSQDGSVRLWDPRTGKQLLALDGELSAVWDLAFAPNGRAVAAVADNTSLVFEVPSGKVQRHYEDNDRPRQAVAYSPDGSLLALAEKRGDVCLHRTADNRLMHKLNDGQGVTGKMAFSPDGRLLAICHQEKLRLWDTATGKQVEALEGNPFAYLLAFSPDGRILAAGGYDEITLWNVATRKKLGTMQVAPPDSLELHALAYSPDSRMVVMSGWNERYTERRLFFCEAATCQERFHITNPGGPSFGIAFSPDGQSMVTANSDSTLTVWDVAALPEPLTVGKLTPQGLERLWTDLAGVDAAAAYRAIHTLAAVPPQTLPLLKERLKPVAKADAQRLQQLLTDLDSDQFTVRDRATTELARLQESALPALRRAAAGELSVEARRRVEQLLEKLDEPAASPERLRMLRSVEILERIGTPEARQVLETCAQGEPAARLTEEAKAALRRLSLRTSNH